MKRYVITAGLLSLMLLSSCGNNQPTTTKSSVDTSTEILDSETEGETDAERITQFNALPQNIQTLLATTVVDTRAEPLEFDGYVLHYNYENEDLIVSVSSEMSTGEPWFRLHITEDSVTAVDGLNWLGTEGVEAIKVNTEPVSKAELFKLYQTSQSIYDKGAQNSELSKEMTVEAFEANKAMIDNE